MKNTDTIFMIGNVWAYHAKFLPPFLLERIDFQENAAWDMGE